LLSGHDFPKARMPPQACPVAPVADPDSGHALFMSPVESRVDARLEDRGRFEHHDTARRDRHFLTSLRVASDPLPFLAYHERSERGKLHGFAALETIGDFLEDQFDQARRLRA